MPDRRTTVRLSLKENRQLQDAVLAAAQDGYFDKPRTRAEAVEKFAKLMGRDIRINHVTQAVEVMEIKVRWTRAGAGGPAKRDARMQALAQFVATLASELGKEVPADIIDMAGGRFLDPDGVEQPRTAGPGERSQG